MEWTLTVSAIFTSIINFVTFCFLYCTLSPFRKGIIICSQRKELALQEQILSCKSRLLLTRETNISDRVTSFAGESIPLKITCNQPKVSLGLDESSMIRSLSPVCCAGKMSFQHVGLLISLQSLSIPFYTSILYMPHAFIEVVFFYPPRQKFLQGGYKNTASQRMFM